MSATDDDHELLNGMPLTEIVHGTALEKAAPYRAFAEVWALRRALRKAGGVRFGRGSMRTPRSSAGV